MERDCFTANSSRRPGSCYNKKASKSTGENSIMSFITIADFIKSGRQSLDAKNYWSALSVALMLPSMCSRLAYANKPDYQKPNGDCLDRKCYIDWCTENIDKDRWIISCLGDKYAEVLYDIRCDIVHAGCAHVYPKHYPDGLGFYFSINDNEISTEMAKYRIVSVSTLCEQIFFNVENWCCKFGLESRASSFTRTWIFDREVKDDRLLYRRLCDEDRADYLKEQFDKENPTTQQ